MTINCVDTIAIYCKNHQVACDECKDMDKFLHTMTDEELERIHGVVK